MSKRFFCLVLFLITLISLWQSSINLVMAADCVETALGCIPYNLNGFSTSFLQILFGIAGGIAFLLMIYGFILMATSGGDPKKVQGAKETVTSAIIGLLVAIFALFIYRYLTINVLNIPLTGVTSSNVSSSGNSSKSTSGTSSNSDTSDDAETSSENTGVSSNTDETSEDNLNDSASIDDNAGGYTGGYYAGDVSAILEPISSMANVSQPTATIPCNGDMTQYQNQLDSEIRTVGTRTRNAVVVAANYLAAEFPYKVPYFLNGGHSDRDLNGGFLGSGSSYTTKWGCDRLEGNKQSSKYGKVIPNGLDCSGFVSWAYLTAGFKDVSGNKEYRWNKGNFERIGFSNANCSYIKSKIQPGDVLQIKTSGKISHTAIVLAYDDNEIKFAQSSGSRGVNIEYINICTGKKTRGKNSFTLISFMSNYFDKFSRK